MKKLSRILSQSTEYLLLLAVLFYWFSTRNTLNPIALGLISILILQIIVKSKILGLITASILVVAGTYMLFALASELTEFTIFNTDARKMLLVGSIFFISTIVVSAVMIYKYYPLADKKNYQQTTDQKQINSQ